MTKKQRYSWEEFQADAEVLAKQINMKDFDCIVGITRGGIFLAGMLAEITGKLELYTIGFNGYKNTKKSTQVAKTTSLHPDLTDKKILLVDDISDSGDTLQLALDNLYHKRNTVKVVTIHYKKGTKVMPDYCLHETNKWIAYSWDYNN